MPTEVSMFTENRNAFPRILIIIISFRKQLQNASQCSSQFIHKLFIVFVKVKILLRVFFLILFLCDSLLAHES